MTQMNIPLLSYKIGDGSTLINNLPFSTEEEIESYAAPISHTHNYAGSSAGGAAINAGKLSTARDIIISGTVKLLGRCIHEVNNNGLRETKFC